MRSFALGLVLLLGVSCASDPGPQPSLDPQPTSTAASDASAKPAPKADPTLPPRNAFFGNPDRIAPQLSPDGKHLAFLAPVEGVMNVWVGPASDPTTAKPVTKETKRGLRQYFWTILPDQLVYMQDQGGDENFHLYGVDVTKGTVTDLTALDGVRAQVVGRSHKVPGKLLVGLNDRDKRHHDVYEIDVKTAKLQSATSPPPTST